MDADERKRFGVVLIAMVAFALCVLIVLPLKIIEGCGPPLTLFHLVVVILIVVLAVVSVLGSGVTRWETPPDRMVRAGVLTAGVSSFFFALMPYTPVIPMLTLC